MNNSEEVFISYSHDSVDHIQQTLIYQHFYNAGSLNRKFIPVVFEHKNRKFIPTPLQGSTYYCPVTDDGYNELYSYLTGQNIVEKPALGERRALPKKSVITDPTLYITSPIDVELWNKAEWSGTFIVDYRGKPPILGFLQE